MRRALLMYGRHQGDVGAAVDESVEQRRIAVARNAEGMGDAFADQMIDDDLAARLSPVRSLIHHTLHHVYIRILVEVY